MGVVGLPSSAGAERWLHLYERHAGCNCNRSCDLAASADEPKHRSPVVTCPARQRPIAWGMEPRAQARDSRDRWLAWPGSEWGEGLVFPAVRLGFCYWFDWLLLR